MAARFRLGAYEHPPSPKMAEQLNEIALGFFPNDTDAAVRLLYTFYIVYAEAIQQGINIGVSIMQTEEPELTPEDEKAIKDAFTSWKAKKLL